MLWLPHDGCGSNTPGSSARWVDGYGVSWLPWACSLLAYSSKTLQPDLLTPVELFAPEADRLRCANHGRQLGVPERVPMMRLPNCDQRVPECVTTGARCWKYRSQTALLEMAQVAH